MLSTNLLQYLTGPMKDFQLIIFFIDVILHVIFAGAVAKDAGQLTKRGVHTSLVSGVTWAFATLIGGIMVAAIYWLIHHSTLNRTK